MHRQRPESIFSGPYRPQRLILPNIPQLDLSVPTPTDQFSEAATLHMHICDPLFVVAPAFDHCLLGA